jgi:small subunit ribosomal protein S6
MPQQQRTYEVMYIIRPDLAEEETERVVSSVESSATTAGITVKNAERMGKRRLAYKVRRFQDGVYVLLTVEGPGSALAELERRLRVTEPVIKYITVRVDEEQKRLAKIKKIRDSKVRQRPQPTETAAGTEPAPVTA